VSPTKKEPVYFTRVVAIEPDYAIMASHFVSEETEPTLTRIFFIDGGEWFWPFDIDEIAYGVAVIAPAARRPRTLLVLGRAGTFVRAPAGSKPQESQVSFDNDDFWTDLVVHGERAYACGTRRTVAEYSAGRWRRIDAGIRVVDDDATDQDWSAAAVAPDGSLLVCGDGGAVYRWDQKSWTDLAAPTNMSLSAIACLADGTIVVGSDGVVFVRAPDGTWTQVKLDVDDTVEAILESPHGVLLLTMHTMLRLGAQAAQPVLAAADFEIDFADFDAVGNHVWIVGDGLAIRWDGKRTRRHVCPENI